MQKLVFNFWKIIGKIVSIFPACEEAKLHYQTFERFKVKQLLVCKSWSAQVTLSSDCIKELHWWHHFLATSNLSQSLYPLVPSETIFCDASGFAYGSTWRGCKIQGMFTPKQKALSINTKELLAVYYTIGAHCR